MKQKWQLTAFITPGGLSTILEIARSLELEKLFDKHARVKI